MSWIAYSNSIPFHLEGQFIERYGDKLGKSFTGKKTAGGKTAKLYLQRNHLVYMDMWRWFYGYRVGWRHLGAGIIRKFHHRLLFETLSVLSATVNKDLWKGIQLLKEGLILVTVLDQKRMLFLPNFNSDLPHL